MRFDADPRSYSETEGKKQMERAKRGIQFPHADLANTPSSEF